MDPGPSINQTPQSTDISSSCPFCTIATAFPPISPTSPTSIEFDPEKLSPPSYVILSSPHVIGFLDIAPLTRGHVLVAPRKHRVKIGDLTSSEGAEIGRLLPLLTRSVLRAVFPSIPPSEADYNVVQNNGHLAAQVVPHVHFHIIPRPDPSRTHPQNASPAYPSSHSRFNTSYTMFGRGARNELDDADAAVLAPEMRRHVQEELERMKRDEGVDLEWSPWRNGTDGNEDVSRMRDVDWKL